jgi:glycosyltransferase involved in cell wall biosynthesis
MPEILELGLGEAIRWPKEEDYNKGLPWSAPEGWDMNRMYNAADVVLETTCGEGAGMPLLEGASCGVPGITTDYAAGPEYVGPGLAVPYSDYIIINTPGSRYALVDIDRAADAITKIMNADRGKLARKCRAFAERMDWAKIMEQYWAPFLSEAEMELRPKITKEGVGSWK